MGWEIEFSYGSTNCRGVTILVGKNIFCEINNIDRDGQGRFILLDCKDNDVQHILVSLLCYSNVIFLF